MTNSTALIYPHQLYENNPAVEQADIAILIEDPLFFSQYNFHFKKLVLHRASMQAYKCQLAEKSKKVLYIESAKIKRTEDILNFIPDKSHVYFMSLNDDWLERRLKKSLINAKIEFTEIEDPNFLTSLSTVKSFSKNKKKLFFTEFYISQRKKLKILLSENENPVGEKWSFDSENRKRLPADLELPVIAKPQKNQFTAEAIKYVLQTFPDALGEKLENFNYPVTREESVSLLDDFIKNRLKDFGTYEDAISSKESIIFHSVLSVPLNIGLITPAEIINKVSKLQKTIPLNSLEGFIRQVIGWREYIRLVYLCHGRIERTANFFNFTDNIPESLYSGTTGIIPVDHVIRKLHHSAYCHHIERLMILGNFMLLCRINPDKVYQWFMEFFIDSYDWVMVPNVYGMSQYADGGLMSTKPYISGSSYILKMSDFNKGEWCNIWDSLYWSFIDDYYDLLKKNPRMSMMTALRDKMKDKILSHQKTAVKFRKSLGLSN